MGELRATAVFHSLQLLSLNRWCVPCDLLQRSLESFETEKSSLESDNAALRKALHSLEVGPWQQA